VISTRKCP